MTVRKKLTDENVLSLPIKRKRYLVHDAVMPGLAVRVGKSRRTWVLVARFNNHTSRKSLGVVGKISVAQARDRAKRMHSQLSGEHDTTVTFGEVAEQLFHHVRHHRSADEIERALRRDAAPLFSKAIASVTKRDIIALLEAKGDKRSSAHHLYAYLRRAFAFAVDRDILEHNVCARIKPQQLLGAKSVRSRVLTDDELRKIWRATFELGDPYGSAVRLILLTGARRSEASGARIREFDIIKREWVLPAERVKSAAQHVVPLTGQALIIVTGMMAATEGSHLFGHELRGWSKVKRRLDTIAGIEHWTLHDLRRTFRTRLSGLGIAEHVAELAIAHARKGLMRVYDQHRYTAELRDAFERWEQALLAIVRTGKSEPAQADKPGFQLLP